MHRTQIQLTQQQFLKLQGEARARGTSIAYLIREAVEALPLSGVSQSRLKRALVAIESLKKGSGRSDISQRHDDYLAEDFR